MKSLREFLEVKVRLSSYSSEIVSDGVAMMVWAQADPLAVPQIMRARSWLPSRRFLIPFYTPGDGGPGNNKISREEDGELAQIFPSGKRIRRRAAFAWEPDLIR